MKLLLAASAAACLIAGTASAQTYAYTWTPAGTLAPTPPAPTFLMFAGAGDLYEFSRASWFWKPPGTLTSVASPR